MAGPCFVSTLCGQTFDVAAREEHPQIAHRAVAGVRSLAPQYRGPRSVSVEGEVNVGSSVGERPKVD